jgi:hypothetical protein
MNLAQKYLLKHGFNNFSACGNRPGLEFGSDRLPRGAPRKRRHAEINLASPFGAWSGYCKEGCPIATKSLRA